MRAQAWYANLWRGWVCRVSNVNSWFIERQAGNTFLIHEKGSGMENETLTQQSPTPDASLEIAPVKIGLVGCGWVGNVHRERLVQEAVKIVAICDPDADSLSQMASLLPRRPRLFRSELDLLASGLAEAVVLCTPHARHAAQCRAALEADVHVLCEKPFVTQLPEAERLIALARERNRALWVSYTRRSRGHARFLEAAAPRIAPLTQILVCRAQPWVQKHGRTWRMRTGEGGGFLLDNGASILDLLLRIVQAPVTDVSARLSRHGGGEIDTGGLVQLAFANGVQATLTLIGDSTEEIETIRLFGENGTAGWLLREETPNQLYIRPTEGPSEPGHATPYRIPLPDAAFVNAISERTDFSGNAPISLHDAQTTLPVIALLERIYREAVWE